MQTRSFLVRARRGRSARRSGFTLIEILVVIVIIAVLASVVGPEVISKVGSARTSTAQSQIDALKAALDSYRLENGSYPTTQQGLDALVTMPTIDAPPTWRGPYLQKNAVPLDPWNRAYIYASPPTINLTGGYDLYTLGKDGLPQGTGEDADITSWQ